MIDFDSIKVLSFDCYGTLIDWESGIASALRPVLKAREINLSEQQTLELYAELESEIEGDTYITYREVLRRIMQQLGVRYKFSPTKAELNALANSLADWKPFSDTVESLRRFHSRFKLAIISNIDDDLFELTARHLEIEFDWLITAKQVGAYKPSLDVFRFAYDRIGMPKEKMLHVAQSLYHDIAPANRLGQKCVWVNRREHRDGFGATPRASAQPDLEVSDLKTLVSMIPGI
jgi:2-haloacid dehalogenase